MVLNDIFSRYRLNQTITVIHFQTSQQLFYLPYSWKGSNHANHPKLSGL